MSIFAANPLVAFIVILEIVTVGFLGFLVGGQLLLIKAIIKAQGPKAGGGLETEAGATCLTLPITPSTPATPDGPAPHP